MLYLVVGFWYNISMDKKLEGLLREYSPISTRYLALEEYRRNTELADGMAVNYVKIGVRHLSKVMEGFSKSVSSSLIKDYEAFRESRKQGV